MKNRFQIGSQIDVYHIEEYIAEGGTSEIWRITQEDKKYALKSLKPQWIHREDVIKRFYAEAAMLLRFDHPHIVTVYAQGEVGEIPYFIMEYAIYGHLGEFVRNNRFTFQEACQYLSQVSDALMYAHTQGVIHRDLKPRNVLLKSPSHILLTDFGIARNLGGTQMTMMGLEQPGTPEYMSPEQINNDAITRASDQYSLGVLAYWFFVGQLPYRGTDVYDQHRYKWPVTPSEANEQLTQEIDNIILRVLAKYPDERYSNVWHFTEALQQAVDNANLANEIIVRGQGDTTNSQSRTSGMPSRPTKTTQQNAETVKSHKRILSEQQNTEEFPSSQMTADAQHTLFAEKTSEWQSNEIQTILSQTKTLTITPSATTTPTSTPTNIDMATFTPTTSFTLTPTSTTTYTATPTETATHTSTNTPTNTATITPTNTAMHTATPTDISTNTPMIPATATRCPSSTPLTTSQIDSTVIGSIPFSDRGTAPLMNRDNEPAPSCGQNVGNAVWYSYRPRSGQDLIVSTSGSSYDTVLSIWTRSAGAWHEVACNNDFSELTSQLTFYARGGITHYIMIGGYGGASGQYSLEIMETYCIVQAPPRTEVNVQSGPGTNHRVEMIITLSDGALQVTGKTRNTDGFIWWQISNDWWARSDVVDETGNCDNAPFID